MLKIHITIFPPKNDGYFRDDKQKGIAESKAKSKIQFSRAYSTQRI